VTRGTLRRCIQEGCESDAALGERTRAGTVCGACLPRLKEMLGRPDWTPVVCSEVIRVTDDIRSFRFRPCTGGLKPARPGQHVVAQARIDDRWVERPYTLSSPASQTDFYEITVKREPRGLFSSWLFDQMQGEALIRVSSPQGDFVLDDGDAAPPAVCLVGGIGMTPALAMLRSIVASGSRRRLHIDYSCSHARQFASGDELERAAREHANVTLRRRATREAGHIARADIAAIVADLPGATFFICGPTAFQRHVQGILAAIGVPRARIRTEEFTPQGDRPPTEKARRTGPVGHPAAKAPPTRAPGPRPGDAPAVPEVLASQPGSVRDEARAYLLRFFHEHGVPQAFEARWREVEAEIERTGTYEQTYDELSFGAKLAWRNSARCIGRLFWHGLQVRDLRHLATEEQIFEALCEHIRLATNGGNLRAVMSVFRPQRPGEPAPRLWNPQLIRYAGYKQKDGSWIGDPANAAVTRAILKLGWRRPKRERTPFDILPLVIELPGRAPRLFEVPKDLVLEVPLTHPEHPWFADLGLRWYALPAVSEMLFDCGGMLHARALQRLVHGDGDRRPQLQRRVPLQPAPGHRREAAPRHAPRPIALEGPRPRRAEHRRPPLVREGGRQDDRPPRGGERLHGVRPAGGRGGAPHRRALELDRAASVGVGDPRLPRRLARDGDQAQLLLSAEALQGREGVTAPPSRPFKLRA